LEEEGVALVTVNGEGVSLTVSQKTDVGGLQIHLLKAGKSFFGRGYIDVLLKVIEIPVAAGGDDDYKENLTEKPISSKEVSYEGVLKMLNSCQIIRTVDYRQNLIYGPSFNSCDKVCSLQNNTVIGKGHICISAARGQFDENNKLLPSYLEPINCRSETSMIQFQLYCTCCSAP